MKKSWPKQYKQYDPEIEGYGSERAWKDAFYERISPEEAWEILNEEDPYHVLGVTRSDSKERIKSVFRSLAKFWHPDKNPDNIEEATEMMKKINAAYSLINY